MNNHQDEYDLLKQKIKTSFWRGVMLVGVTVWFIPGIIFRFLGLTPPQEENFVDGLIRFSYSISPRISSISDILSSSKQDGDLLKIANAVGLFILLLIIWGVLSINSGWEYLTKRDVLREQVRDEDIKASIRRRNNRK
jgi:hypothetical protein